MRGALQVFRASDLPMMLQIRTFVYFRLFPVIPVVPAFRSFQLSARSSFPVDPAFQSFQLGSRFTVFVPVISDFLFFLSF
jgi:hypothetical protein